LSTKLPCPRSRDASSLRSTGCPTSFSVTAIGTPYAFAPAVWPAASRIACTMLW
jgi:hypothetical protein